jgi:hypothetical protein
MAPARAAAYIGGATLLLAWLASAAGVSRAHPAARLEQRPGDLVQLDAIASDVQSEAARLRTRLAAAPAPAASRRNPFSFAAPETAAHRSGPPAQLPPAATVVPVVPELVIEFLGIAEQKTEAGTVRTAMLAAPDDQLFMVTEGQEVGGRYRVSAIGADAVELNDLITGSTRRLALK